MPFYQFVVAQYDFEKCLAQINQAGNENVGIYALERRKNNFFQASFCVSRTYRRTRQSFL